MKQKFLLSMLIFLAFLSLLFFSSKSALAIDESTNTAVTEADQSAHEDDNQAVHENAPVEKDSPAEDKYTPPEVPEDDVNRVESDYEVHEREEGQDLRSQDENKADGNKALEGELTTQGERESNPPAGSAGVEDKSQHNQPENAAGAAIAPSEQQAPETEK